MNNMASRGGRRWFVYFLSSDSGELLYIGRSCRPVARMKAHVAEAASPDTMQALRKALWFMDVRRVDMIGPFHWGEATIRERELIALAQPYGNLRLNPLARQLGRSAKRVNAA